MKLVVVLFGVRLLLGVPSVPNRAIAEMLREHQYLVATVLIVYFGAQFALCLALRRGLKLGRAWAFTVGYIYSGFHILGALGFTRFGLVLLLNAALGVFALVYLRKVAAPRATVASPN